METQHRTTESAWGEASLAADARQAVAADARQAVGADTCQAGAANVCQAAETDARQVVVTRASGRGFSGLSSFTLKVVAIIGMTFNHAAYVFYPYLPFGIRCVMLAVGGMTFPIMAFLLVEGYRHTSNLKRYACRLAVFAAVSQLPYWLFLSHSGNVLLTLLLSLVVLWLYDTMSNRLLFWGLFVLATAASATCDWGVFGPVMVLMIHVLRGSASARVGSCFGEAGAATCADEAQRAWRKSIVLPTLIPLVSTGISELAAVVVDIAALPFLLYAAVGNTAAIGLLLAYNGRRGRPMKWLFYAYYPAHIAVLGMAKGLLLGDWSLGF
ncbi:TraX family protein [Adlercreutzia sp. ZJ141]|uniref:TraX family protein n=1 Tax=Adlercreutzia sp. ZJ141 TaxID=2709406 RepID=UPI0013EE148F|nr:TraX family protein [Adlercreutzia sp. ZJ141]